MYVGMILVLETNTPLVAREKAESELEFNDDQKPIASTTAQGRSMACAGLPGTSVFEHGLRAECHLSVADFAGSCSAACAYSIE